MKNGFPLAVLASLLISLLTACQGVDPNSQSLTLKPGSDPTGVGSVPIPIPSGDPSAPSNPGALYSGPAEVEKYILQFVDDGRAEGVDVTANMKNPILTVQIADLGSYGSTVIGLCETSGNQRKVTFSPAFWNAASETQRLLLVHHELGHCVLYRPHLGTLLTSGAYTSIMYPVILADATYLSDQAYYLKELFTTNALQSATPTPLSASQIHICHTEDL